MNPTLRQGLSFVARAWSGLRRRTAAETRAGSRRALRPVVSGLEDRTLQYFGIQAHVVPLQGQPINNTLWPPSGKYVEVNLVGSMHEFAIVKGKTVFEQLPGTKQALFTVTDEYRQDEPSGPLQLKDLGGGVYQFSTTFHLQARRATEFSAGRRYFVTVAAKDTDGWFSHEIAVQVPIGLHDRGQPPIPSQPSKIPPKHAKASKPPSTSQLPFGL